MQKRTLLVYGKCMLTIFDSEDMSHGPMRYFEKNNKTNQTQKTINHTRIDRLDLLYRNLFIY